MFDGAFKPTGPTLYIDGGARLRDAQYAALHPQLSIGDGDSGGGLTMQVKLPVDKSQSDLAYALHSLPLQITEVVLLGFLGGRRDHELINLGEAQQFLKRSAAPRRVYFDRQIIGLSAGDFSFNYEGTFSLVAFEPGLVQITGDCAYPLEQPTHLPGITSLGLSNRAYGQVQIHTTCCAFVFYIENP